MKKLAVKRAQRALGSPEQDAVEPMHSAFRTDAFISFRYSQTEISASGGKAHVKARRIQLENGKLACESIEGELEPNVYANMVSDAQRHVLGQTMHFMKFFTSLLPFARDSGRDRD
jgi:hypothetical protein